MSFRGKVCNIKVLVRHDFNFCVKFKEVPSLINISETSYRILMKFWNLLINEATKLLSFEVFKKNIKN